MIGKSVLALITSLPFVFAQTAAPPTTASQTAAAHARAFDVVSIRPAKPGTPWTFNWMTTPDGYHVTGQSLFYTIMIAYFPQGTVYWSDDRLAGAPQWINDLYEIDARVSDADLTDLDDWHRKGPALSTKPMLRQMLQTMLADRCHLVAHMVPGPPIRGFSLEVGKRGARLTESKPDEVLPAGVKLADGGVMVGYGPGQKPHFSFYRASMADLARNLAGKGGRLRPVLDRTGLTGRYDFVLDWVDDPDSTLPVGVIDSDDPDPLSHWDLDRFGLRTSPIDIPAETLVIDHIERPSEN
jgi:uncharacterized protein (TIGR03435 family)